jgi:hypothetical protein
MLITLLLVTSLGYFYAADLKGIWNDDAVRLTIANGGLAKAGIESRHPGHLVDVIEAIGRTLSSPRTPPSHSHPSTDAFLLDHCNRYDQPVYLPLFSDRHQPWPPAGDVEQRQATGARAYYRR